MKMLKELGLYTYSFQKLSPYRRDFDETNYMSFLIKNDELLEKCNKIWKKVSNSMKKEFNSEPKYTKNT